MATTQYIGARYVPILADPVEWSSEKTYEPLTIVTNEGNSYTSRQFVPKGINIDNTDYWALTGNYNAQVEQYRRETQHAIEIAEQIQDDVVTLKSQVSYVTPEMFGAKGDGITNDTQAILAAINTGLLVNFSNNAKYLIDPIAIEDKNDIYLYGNNALLICDTRSDSHNNVGILRFTYCNNILIDSLRVTTNQLRTNDEYTDIVSLFNTGMFGIYLQHCNNIKIVNCEVSLVKDGYSTEYCKDFYLLNSSAFNCGQEPVAIRHTPVAFIYGNDFKWHLGDGILFKDYEYDIYTPTIVAHNILHDGKTGIITTIIGEVITNKGGGVTCNAETINTGHLNKGLIISNNIFDNTNYGILIGNISNTLVVNNFVHVGAINGAYVQAGIGLELDPVNNLENAILHDVTFANNFVIGGRVGYRTYTTRTVEMKDILFIGNTFIDGEFETIFAIRLRGGYFINNKVTSIAQSEFYEDCVVKNNIFKSDSPYSTPQNAPVRTYGNSIFTDNICELCCIYCITDSIICKNNIIKNDSQNAPLLFAGTSPDSVGYISGNIYNNEKINRTTCILAANTSNYETDFYRRATIPNTNITVEANDEFIHIFGTVNITSISDIGTINDPYFHPATSQQLFGFIQNNIARLIYLTDGTLSVRASSITQGEIVLNSYIAKKAI